MTKQAQPFTQPHSFCPTQYRYKVAASIGCHPIWDSLGYEPYEEMGWDELVELISQSEIGRYSVRVLGLYKRDDFCNPIAIKAGSSGPQIQFALTQEHGSIPQLKLHSRLITTHNHTI